METAPPKNVSFAIFPLHHIILSSLSFFRLGEYNLHIISIYETRRTATGRLALSCRYTAISLYNVLSSFFLSENLMLVAILEKLSPNLWLHCLKCSVHCRPHM